MMKKMIHIKNVMKLVHHVQEKEIVIIIFVQNVLVIQIKHLFIILLIKKKDNVLITKNLMNI
jgi:putative heme degradation protein